MAMQCLAPFSFDPFAQFWQELIYRVIAEHPRGNFSVGELVVEVKWKP
jgi:hypothetical protein